MVKSFSTLGAVVLLAVLATGCAGPEKKIGRGVNNIYEPIRLAEMRRSIEQTSLADPTQVNYHHGVIKGFNRTVARFGIGVYELVTAPIPNYHNKSWDYNPVASNYLTTNPLYPDSYKPGLKSDAIFATDTSIGFSGGDVAPFIPGSRFYIFD